MCPIPHGITTVIHRHWELGATRTERSCTRCEGAAARARSQHALVRWWVVGGLLLLLLCVCTHVCTRACARVCVLTCVWWRWCGGGAGLATRMRTPSTRRRRSSATCWSRDTCAIARSFASSSPWHVVSLPHRHSHHLPRLRLHRRRARPALRTVQTKVCAGKKASPAHCATSQCGVPAPPPWPWSETTKLQE